DGAVGPHRGEEHPLARQAVDVRAADIGGTVGREVSISQIVGENQNQIRPRFGLLRTGGKTGGKRYRETKSEEQARHDEHRAGEFEEGGTGRGSANLLQSPERGNHFLRQLIGEAGRGLGSLPSSGCLWGRGPRRLPGRRRTTLRGSPTG